MTATTIEWTDVTWNPLRGCSRVSDGCRHCYAERVAARFSGPGQPYEGLVKLTAKGPTWTGAVRTIPEKLAEPMHWRKPRRVFVNSMSDLFHASVSDEFILSVFAVMAACPQHTFQVLTKRAERMQQLLSASLMPGWPFPNVWMGVSVEDQPTADERIPLLMRTPAAVRWISAEPLLGPVDLHKFVILQCDRGSVAGPGGIGGVTCPHCNGSALMGCALLDWVVAGGESGPGARPMHPEWVASIRHQCAAAGVPWLFKQWGEWMPEANYTYAQRMADAGQIEECYVRLDGTTHWIDPDDKSPYSASDALMVNIGKKAAGRLLDGVVHDAYPERRP